MVSAIRASWRTWLFTWLTYVGSERLRRVEGTWFGRWSKRLFAHLIESGSIQVRGGPAFGLRLAGRFLPVDHRQGYGLVRGVLETGVQEALRRSVAPGSVVFDVGANIGFFSLLSAKLAGPEGRVVAFEPVPESAGAVIANARLNGLSTIEVRQCAVADRDGSAQICIPRVLSWSHLTDYGVHRDTQAVRLVEVVSLDSEIAAGKLPVPQVVKIDVEGAEVEVLNGLRQTLLQHRIIVICEIHAANAAVLALADELGYTATNLESTHDIANAGPVHVLLSKAQH
jgi:FkbM family methyltransferase